jgi:hypothetical protein
VSGVAARRLAVIVAIVLAGILAVVGTIADPAPEADGAELVEAYVADPGRVEVKSVAYHFSYTLWMAAALGIVALVRIRGSWLANAAGVLAILGISTMPGFLIGDFVDVAFGRELGAAETARIGDEVQEWWGFLVMAVPGLIGMVLALPGALLAAWRAGLVAWWAPAASIAGVGAFVGFGAQLPGNAIMTAAFGVVAYALWRIPLELWLAPGSAVAPEPAAGTSAGPGTARPS